MGCTRNYFPAAEKGLVEAMEEGVLAGYPVTNVKANLYDGSYHSVDSEMSFAGGSPGFQEGYGVAKPVLLEPITMWKWRFRGQHGDIIGDLNSRRGRVMGMEPAGKKQVIKAHAPAEMAKYTIDLKSMTQGAANSAWSFPTTKRCRLKMPRRSSKRPDVKGKKWRSNSTLQVYKQRGSRG